MASWVCIDRRYRKCNKYVYMLEHLTKNTSQIIPPPAEPKVMGYEKLWIERGFEVNINNVFERFNGLGISTPVGRTTE